MKIENKREEIRELYRKAFASDGKGKDTLALIESARLKIKNLRRYAPERWNLVVTRHEALIQYLKEMRYISDNVPIIRGNATIEDVQGKMVIGVLPYHLACTAHRVGVVPLNVSFGQRGKELTLDEIYVASAPLEEYVVMRWRRQAYGNGER